MFSAFIKDGHYFVNRNDISSIHTRPKSNPIKNKQRIFFHAWLGSQFIRVIAITLLSLDTVKYRIFFHYVFQSNVSHPQCRSLAIKPLLCFLNLYPLLVVLHCNPSCFFPPLPSSIEILRPRPSLIGLCFAFLIVRLRKRSRSGINFPQVFKFGTVARMGMING